MLTLCFFDQLQAELTERAAECARLNELSVVAANRSEDETQRNNEVVLLRKDNEELQNQLWGLCSYTCMVVVCSILLVQCTYVHSLAYYPLVFPSPAGQTLPSMLLLLHNHRGNGLVRLDRFCICVECVECHVIDRNSSVTPECTEKAGPLYLFAAHQQLKYRFSLLRTHHFQTCGKIHTRSNLCVWLFLLSTWKMRVVDAQLVLNWQHMQVTSARILLV